MKIIVCIKQVPAKDAPLAIAGNWIKESDIGFEMNEPDSFALEEALRLKEKHGGEVIALSMGPERVKQTIKEALIAGFILWMKNFSSLIRGELRKRFRLL
jgi:electron transfer flavoprotein beta subunit